jgi:hypothetical protein
MQMQINGALRRVHHVEADPDGLAVADLAVVVSAVMSSHGNLLW